MSFHKKKISLPISIFIAVLYAILASKSDILSASSDDACESDSDFVLSSPLKRPDKHLQTHNERNVSDIVPTHSVGQNLRCRNISLEVLGIHPKMGSELGGARVAVAVRFNHDVSGSSVAPFLRCNFGQMSRKILRSSEVYTKVDDVDLMEDSTVGAVLKDKSIEMLCNSPPFPMAPAIPGSVPFSISCEDNNYTEAPDRNSFLTYEYTIAAMVHSIHPFVGQHGTRVTVKGSGFKNSSSLRCFFGPNIGVATIFFSDDTIICDAPKLQYDGDYFFAVSNNGVDLEGDWGSSVFTYAPPPLIISVYPPKLTWHDSLMISVSGKNLLSRKNASSICLFGDNLTTLATVDDDDKLHCIVPKFHELKKKKPFSKNIRVSTNDGVDFSFTSSQVVFYPPIILYSVTPNAAPEMGSILTLRGNNFFQSDSLVCEFQLCEGNDEILSVPAKAISFSIIQCDTPSSKYGNSRLWVSTTGDSQGRSINSMDFTFLNFLSVSSIVPAMGSLTGGSLVKVQGAGFEDKFLSVICRFGVAVVPASRSLISKSEVQCISPPVTAALDITSSDILSILNNEQGGIAVSLEISVNSGYDFSSSGLQFRYYNDTSKTECTNSLSHHEVELFSIYPLGGSELGGTEVEIKGKHFFQRDMKCLFDNIESHLTYWISSTTIRCITPESRYPSLNPYPVNVTVIMSGNKSLSPTSLEFIYFPVFDIVNFSPSFGSTHGGTIIHVHGGPFLRTKLYQPLCTFPTINKTSIATVLSSTLVKCAIPRVNLLGESEIGLSLNGGTDVTISDSKYSYISQVFVKSVTPIYIPTSGGEVFILGENFIPNTNVTHILHCAFNGRVVAATVINEGMIVCLSPPMEPSIVDVSVATNGVDFVSAGQELTYHRPFEIHEMLLPNVSDTNGVMIGLRGAHYQPSPDLSCIISSSRQKDNIVIPASFVSDYQVNCFVPFRHITGILQLSGSKRHHVDNPRVSINYDFIEYSEANLIEMEVYSVDSMSGLEAQSKTNSHQITVDFIEPRIISELLESNITIFIDEWTEGKVTSCVFSLLGTNTSWNIQSQAFITKKSVIACRAPTLSKGVYALSLKLDDNDGTNIALLGADILVQPAFFTIGFSPISGTEGSTLHVYGGNFPRSGLFCKIGNIVTNAKFVTDDEVSCKIPPRSIERNSYANEFTAISDIEQVIVSISVNGVDFAKVDDVMFTYTKRPFLYGVSPKEGIATGGTPLIIIGDNIYPIDQSIEGIFLSFNGSVVKGISLNESAVACLSPPYNSTTYPASVSVQISTNRGFDYYDSDLIFTYLHLPLLSYLEPTHGPKRGGADIRIFGNRFTPHPSAACRFGEIITEAKIISEYIVECTAPKSLTQTTVDVTFTINGVDWTEQSLAFNYVSYEDILQEVNASENIMLSTVLPPHGSVKGKTILFIETETIAFFGDSEAMSCSFMLKNDSSVYETLAVQINGSMFSCLSPNVEKASIQSYDVAVITLVSRKSGVTVSSSLPFLFKLSPIIRKISPTVGSTNGGTRVRVFAEDDHGVFLNSTALACYFAEEKSKAIWISSTSIDCISPPLPGHLNSVVISISDNGVDRVESNMLYSFFPSPTVTSVSPRFFFVSEDKTLIIDGYGFLGVSKPVCIFEHTNGYQIVRVNGRVLSEKSMECDVNAYELIAAKYTVAASNNGGVEWERSTVFFVTAPPPSIFSLSPTSGISNHNVTVKVLGEYLYTEMLPTYCVLLDEDSRQIVLRSAVHIVHDTFVECVMTCLSLPKPKRFVVDISLGEVYKHNELSLLPPFWCEPPPRFFDFSPKIVVVGSSTPIKIAVEDVRSNISCIFQGISEKDVTITSSSHAKGTIECLSPSFFRPQKVMLSIVLNNETVFGGNFELQVVDPISISSIFPLSIFAGSDIAIKGRNFVQNRIDCYIGGRNGIVLMVNDSYVRCRTPKNQYPSVNVSVSLRLKDGPQVNSSSFITIYTTPIVQEVQPFSGLTHGGNKVILRGVGFQKVSSSYCFFGDNAVVAYPLSENAIACFAPESNKAGSVDLALTLDNNRTFFGDQYYSYFNPVIISSIRPRVVANGTKILLKGKGFQVNYPIKCLIGGEISVPATVLSSTTATCRFSSFHSGQVGPVTISLVTVDDISLSVAKASDSAVISHPGVRLLHDSKLFGSVLGGELIQLKISNLLNEDSSNYSNFLLCHFGQKTVSASVDGLLVFCTAPPAVKFKPGSVQLRLSIGEGTLSQNSIEFEYTSLPKFKSIIPNSGSILGGTIVKVLGLNLILPHPDIRCRFGYDESYAFFDASEPHNIQCITPAVNHTSSQILFVKLSSDSKWINTGMNFDFHEPPFVESVSPDPEKNWFFLKGIGFSASMRYSCSIDDKKSYILTEATFISNATLKCPLPEHVMFDVGRSISISITTNGVDFVSAGSFNVERTNHYSIHTLRPNFGPSFGRTLVNVYGAFQQSKTTYCLFGSMTVKAMYLTDSHVQCYSTPMYVVSGNVKSVNLIVTQDGNHSKFISNSLQFHVYSHPMILSITPSHGVDKGGTTIKLRTSSLTDVLLKLEMLHIQAIPMCRFGATVVSSTIESENEFSCVSPSAELSNNSTLIESVSVTLNGVDYAFTEHFFYYYPPPIITTISPDVVWAGQQTEIILQGLNFFPLEGAKCFVGDTTVPAEVLSTSVICCKGSVKSSLNILTFVGITLNGVDTSNILPLRVYVNTPMITAVQPLFVSERGGEKVTLTGYDFDLISKPDAFIMLSDSCVTELHVINDTSSYFITPSSTMMTSSRISVSYGNEAFTDTGFDLTYMSRLLILALDPPFLQINKGVIESRITVFGNSFESKFHYLCVLKDEIDKTSMIAIYLNATYLMCDLNMSGAHISNNTTFSFYIERELDGEKSNDLTIVSTPRYMLQSVDPQAISELGGQVITIKGFNFYGGRAIRIKCAFMDKSGTTVTTFAEIIEENELICTAPMLPIGDIRVHLVKQDVRLLSYSNHIVLKIHPASQIVTLSPMMGPSIGGTQVNVHGYGFLSYSNSTILCQFNEDVSAALVLNDSHVSCVSPSSLALNTTLFLVQTTKHGRANISNGMTFSYYAPITLVKCDPVSGPSSGWIRLDLSGEGVTNKDGSSYLIRFMSVTNHKSTYSRDVKLMSTNKLMVKIPPSPSGADGGMVMIQISQNGQDFSDGGVFFHYTENTSIRSFSPIQTIENTCFNLTFLVDNLFSDLRHCLVDNYIIPVSQRSIHGTVICQNTCLQLTQGNYSVGLVLENNNTFFGSSKLMIVAVSILTMDPSIGPMTGGTDVVVFGNGFELWDGQLLCYFGSNYVVAQVVNSNTLKCRTPPLTALSATSAKKTMNVTFHVTSYHQPCPGEGRNEMTFLYYEPEVIDSFTPKSGSESGGTIVKLHGYKFINTPTLSCRFGDVMTRATYIDENLLECISPTSSKAIKAERVPLMVSNNGQNFIRAGTFSYHLIPKIVGMSPFSGPAFTDIIIQINLDSRWAENPACKIGDFYVRANATSIRSISCLSPQMHDETVNEQHIVTVLISLNGVDFFGDGFFYKYTSLPVIYSLFPGLGPSSGGNLMRIHGKNFLSLKGKVFCRFGSTESTATLISPSKLTCTVPPQNEDSNTFALISTESKISLKHFHDASLLKYVYVPAVTISSIFPRFGSKDGGTEVWVNVDTQMFSSIYLNLLCVFGHNSTTRAQVVDEKVVCVTPPRKDIGLVSLELGVFDQESFEFQVLTSSMGSAQFRYVHTPLIQSVFPLRGPQTGGSVVTLSGKNFFLTEDNSTVHCLFADKKAPAIYISNDQVQCISPGKNIITREIQQIKISLLAPLNTLQEYYSPLSGAFRLCFKNETTDVIGVEAPSDEFKKIVSVLPGLNDISVSIESKENGINPFSSAEVIYNITFFGFVNELQPLVSIKEATSVGHTIISSVERIEKPCCEVKLSLNSVDYIKAPSLFSYDEKVVVRAIVPTHGPIRGGSMVKLTVSGINPFEASRIADSVTCLFGNDEMFGLWTDEETVSCTTPASPIESEVMVGIKIGHVYSESIASFYFFQEPSVYSFHPISLPAIGFETKAINIFGAKFRDLSNLLCVFNSSLPSRNILLPRRHVTQKQPALFHNHSFIQCLNPPTMEAFFSETDAAWAKDPATLNGSLIELHVMAGEDLLARMIIQVSAVVSVTSLHPKNGPRVGGTKVLVTGENFFNSSSLACRFGDYIGPSAQYLTSTKVYCTTPHFPFSHGRAMLPVNIATNGVDFLTSSERAVFEIHEPVVIQEASPLIGEASGNTIVNIVLNDMVMKTTAIEKQNETFQDGVIPDPFTFESPYSSPVCIFNRTIVKADVTGMFSISCSSPPISNSMGAGVPFLISNNDGFDAVDCGIFIYLPTYDRGGLRIEPNHGPKSGGTVVIVKGISREVRFNSSNILCKFGHHISHARNVGINNEFVTCVSPPSSMNNYSSSVEVDFSVLGQSNGFSGVDVIFRYDDDFSLLSLYPASGPITGGTIATIEGGPFYDSNEIVCRFGNKIVNAKFKNYNEIECVSPHLDWIDEVQRVSVFSMASNPEIQTVSAKIVDYQNEIHSCMSSGILDPLNEVQILDISIDRNITDAWAIRFIANGRRSLPVLPSSQDDIESALQNILRLNNVHVTQIFSNSPNAFRYNITAEADINEFDVELVCTVCKEDFNHTLLSYKVVTLQNGTDRLQDDDMGRGFRLVAPGGSLTYPLTQHTRWLHYNETAEGMKEALAGLLPVGFSVNRSGPFGSNAYRWDITLPINESFGGNTFSVVKTGGGAIRLRGTNASVVCVLKHQGMISLGGHFKLSFTQDGHIETTRPISYNSTNKEVQLALEELDNIGKIRVHSLPFLSSHFYQWNITFDNLKNAGDIPLLTADYTSPDAFLIGSNASIEVAETRKGSSNAIYKILVPLGAKHFAILIDGIEGAGIPAQSTGIVVTRSLEKAGVTSVYVEENLVKQKMPTLLHLEPAYGPTSGGTLVIAVGSDFSSSSFCRFDVTIIPAKFISEKLLACKAPQAKDQMFATVSVSNNRINWTTNSATFTYLPELSKRKEFYKRI